MPASVDEGPERTTKNTEPADPKASRFSKGNVSGLSPKRKGLERESSLFAEKSDFSAAGERAAQGDLVRVLEVAAHREPARKPGHGGAVAEPVGEIGRRGLTRHVRV